MSKRKQISILQSFAKMQRIDPVLPDKVISNVSIENITEELDDHSVSDENTSEIRETDHIHKFSQAQTLSDEDRRLILTERFVPSRNWKGPLRTFGEKKRRVPALVFDTQNYPSLSYSHTEDGV